MSTWYKVAWIDPLFAAVNAIAPKRGHAEDGTIGDAAHQAETSGHNPDDTPGVKAERQDADTKPEVRAADVDADLRQPGLSMEAVVQAVLRGPAAERNRLIYIIFNRRIWRAANGWRQETYTGSDPHDKHAHFSGDPAADDNGAPWTSILNLGDDMSVHSDAILEAWRLGAPTAADGSQVEPVKWRIRDEQWQQSVTAALTADKVRDDALAAAVQALAVGSGVDGTALLNEIDRAIAAALSPLQEQLAAVQARNVKLAAALAAAGGALDAADD